MEAKLIPEAQGRCAVGGKETLLTVDNSGWRGHILGVLERVSITWGPSGDTEVGSAGLEGGSSLQEVGN